jgi:hypothetical protein
MLEVSIVIPTFRRPALLDRVADVGGVVGVHHPGRHQVQLVGPVPHDDGVPGVVAALVADHVVHAVAHQVGRLALALIAPLGTHERDRRHWSLPFRSTPDRGVPDPEHG